MGLPKTGGALNVPYVGRSLYELEGGTISYYKAGAAISLNQVVMIDTTTDDQVVVATSAGQDKIVGVCVGRLPKVGLTGGSQPDYSAGPASGEVCIVQINGTVSVVSGGIITRGDKLIPDTATAGRVITGLVFVAPYVHIVGKALQSAAGAAVTIRCKLQVA